MVNFPGTLVVLVDLLSLSIKEGLCSCGGSSVSGAAAVVAACVVVGNVTFDFLFAADLASFSSWS